MKLLSGAVLLHAAEQAYAHAHLAQFPYHDDAALVLMPAAWVLAALGSILFVWGVFAETRRFPASPCS